MEQSYQISIELKKLVELDVIKNQKVFREPLNAITRTIFY
jgi:hypothetical protein